MLSKAILSILGDCWENLICSTLPAGLWESSQPARCTYTLQPDLLGSFPADFCPTITDQFGCGQRTEPFNGGRRVRGRRGGGLLTNNTFQLFYNSTHFSPATLSFQGHYFVQISQPAKIGLEEQIFLSNRWLGAPGQSWFIGSKAWNIAIQLVLQPCCKASCTFLVPASPYNS